MAVHMTVPDDGARGASAFWKIIEVQRSRNGIREIRLRIARHNPVELCRQYLIEPVKWRRHEEGPNRRSLEGTHVEVISHRDVDDARAFA